MDTPDRSQRRRISRVALIGLVAAFVGPLLIAVFMYTHLESWGPRDHVNHGVLVTPVRPLPPMTLSTVDGARLDTDFFRGKWTLVYLGASRCDLGCETALFKTRQARESLGRDAERVQRLFLSSDGGAGIEWPSGLGSEHSDLRLAIVDAESRSAAVAVFGEDAPGQVFVVDPLGNVMMRYPDDATTKGIFKDLKRLLKVSQVG